MSTPTRLVPVILAGGAGTRLWPVSRATLPKPLVKLIGDESLLQQTARRLIARTPPDQIVSVGALAHDLRVERQLAAVAPGLDAHRLLEPVGRNTAAAIALAALYIRDRFAPEAIMWVCPSDHLVTDPVALHRAVDLALPVAAAGDLVTFGITPTRPETGYGYIRVGAALPQAAAVLRAERFVEKPELADAEAMLAQRGYLWNSGMFLFRADRILAELRAHAPAILAAVERAFAALQQVPGGGLAAPQDLYAAVPAAPIDKAVMERAERVAVVPCDPGWRDLGSWQALWEQLAKDTAGNAVCGDALLDAAENCLVHAEHRLVACAGVRDLAVIETGDAVLVTDRRNADVGRRLVALLQQAGRAEATTHLEEQRPWGSLRVLHRGPGFEVKELVIAPGGRLGRQSDDHPGTHWIVVAGRAMVTTSGATRVLEPSQIVRLLPGASNRIENAGDVPLRMIEVRCAGDLRDDDILP